MSEALRRAKEDLFVFARAHFRTGEDYTDEIMTAIETIDRERSAALKKLARLGQEFDGDQTDARRDDESK